MTKMKTIIFFKLTKGTKCPKGTRNFKNLNMNLKEVPEI